MKNMNFLIPIFALLLSACGGHDTPYATEGTYALASSANASTTDYILILFKSGWRAERRAFSVDAGGNLTETSSDCFNYSTKQGYYATEILVDSEIVAVDLATEFVADENVSTQIAAPSGIQKTFVFTSHESLSAIYGSASSVNTVPRCQ